MKLGPAFGDLAGSMWAAIGILAALHKRATTGRGEHVDVALLDGLLGMLGYLAELYFVTGRSPGRVGNNHPTVPAYGLYDVVDGQLVLAAQTRSRSVTPRRWVSTRARSCEMSSAWVRPTSTT